MIALTMDVLQCSIRLCVRLEAVVAQVKGDVKKVNYLLVSFYRNSQPIVVEDMAYFTFNLSNNSFQPYTKPNT